MLTAMTFKSSARSLSTKAFPSPMRTLRAAAATDLREHPTCGRPPAGCSPRQAMEHRLRTVGGVALYKWRGATVEPGLGNLKKIIDGFSRRGRDTAASELPLAATTFNLMKIHRATA